MAEVIHKLYGQSVYSTIDVDPAERSALLLAIECAPSCIHSVLSGLHDKLVDFGAIEVARREAKISLKMDSEVVKCDGYAIVRVKIHGLPGGVAVLENYVKR